MSQVQIALFEADRRVCLLVKDDPSTRLKRSFDLRRKDVRLFSPITDKMNLFKLEQDEEYYWTIMDIRGQVHPIPPAMKEILDEEEWSKVTV